jgi:hypothetical protein
MDSADGWLDLLKTFARLSPAGQQLNSLIPCKEGTNGNTGL